MTLEANIRDRKGSRYAQRLRSEGRIPAVIYGGGFDPISICLDNKETLKGLTGGSRVFDIMLEGKSETCMVKDLQFGWLGDDLIHLDLTRVDLDQIIETNVALHFIGEPPAMNATNAKLDTLLNELRVSCKVKDIPDEIVVRLEGMEGEILTAGDIGIPSNTTLLTDNGEKVCQVSIAEEDDDAEEAGSEA
jgi:large subunit ribosomal protein L25